MKVSTKGRYGLRVMLELALQHGQGPVLVDTIARNQEISGKYIHNLVAGLKSAGLVRTVRGPSGGYVLAHDPKDITIRQVFEALEGKVSPVACVNDRGSCTRADHCAARDLWGDLAEAMDGVLEKVTLAELATRQRVKNDGPTSYQI
ncbi:MAG: Rrf2 family transcriptional regulator [Deltaproteobacteria bacterium]|nr:Rrf2 family transcriptional regulator [Deltaproteobacteria bacterium]